METPQHTLYVRNLDEKVRRDRLKLMLYTAFSRFGNVLDVVCIKRLKLKGQAWVVFKEVAQATEAKKRMHGALLFGKAMDVHYAKTKSDAVARLDGTYKPRPKRKADDAGAEAAGNAKRTAANGTDAPPAAPQPAAPPTAPAAQQQQQQQQEEKEPEPHNVLLAANLPADCPANTLDVLFKQYQGYQASRMVPSRGVAFVDFDSEANATQAKLGLDGFKLDDAHSLKLTYAKK